MQKNGMKNFWNLDIVVQDITSYCSSCPQDPPPIAITQFELDYVGHSN